MELKIKPARRTGGKFTAVLFLFRLRRRRPARNPPPIRFSPPAPKRRSGRRKASLPPTTNDSAAALQLARASFDFADFATNNAEHADIAKTGIAACRQWLAREPKSAPGHYYLAMNFGQLAEAEAPSIAAYKLVKEIEREFKTAAELDGRL